MQRTMMRRANHLQVGRNALVLLLLLLSVSLSACAETAQGQALLPEASKSVDGSVANAAPDALVVTNENVAMSGDDRRRLFNFWSLLFMVGCPPGPLGKPCHDGDESDGSSSSGGSSNGGGNSGGNANSASGGGGGDSDGTNGGSSGASAGAGIAGTNISKTTAWLMIVAAAAACAAVIAAVVGQRRNQQERHQLSGSVDRRMKLFTNLADGNLCGDRPARVVDPRDYQMA